MTQVTTRSDASPRDQKLIEIVLECQERFSAQRWLFEREWYRNILFYIGQQWIVYETSPRRWRQRNLPSWVPLPVTNRLASTANTMRSAIAQVHPAFVAFPTRENEQSILSAGAADKYLDVIMQEGGLRAAKRRMASWLTLTGNGFLLTEFDTSAETGTVFVPGEVCEDCGTQMRPSEIPADMTCPTCGSRNFRDDPSLGMDIPQGRIRVTAKSPFEIYLDNGIMELEDRQELLIKEARDIEGVRRTYGKAAEELTPDNTSDPSQHFLTSLSYMTGTGSQVSGRRFGEGEHGGVTLLRLYVKYHKDYPEGFYVVMSGDQRILEFKEPYPYFFKTTKRKFFPLDHIRYDDVPGRFWGKTPIDDLCTKNKQRNEFESLFQTITMRASNPVWLIPSGVQTSPISGDPAIQVKYTPTGGGLKPERIAGVEPPASILQFIQYIDQDFEELGGTFAAMKGKNPGSVRAASAIQMLIERGFGRYGSVFDNLEEAYEQWAIKALEIWRQKAVFPRVQAVARAAGSWQFMEFLGSDIGEVDIRVEAGSTRPKSQAGRQLLVGQALQWGLLNPQDPEQKMKIFEEMGMISLLPGAEADVKVVAEENARFMAWAQEAAKSLGEGDVPPEQAIQLLLQTFPLKPNPIFDHHPTHVVHHRRLALTDAFRSLPDIFTQLFAQHLMTAHVPYLIQEATTGLGLTGIMAGMLPAPSGNKQQSVSKSGAPESGAGPGGASTPFGGRASSSVST